MKLLGVIRITDYNEPIDSALQSIVHARQHFDSVCIVSQGGPGILAERHTRLLDKYELPVQIVSKLGKIPDQVSAILEIPPLCEVDRLAIDELIEQANQEAKHVNKTHFSMATEMVDTHFSLAYGWLFVLYLVELAWCSYEYFKLPLDRYLRMTLIIRKGTHRMVAPWQFAWRFFNTGQHKTLVRPGWATLQAEPRLRGWALVKNSIYRHEWIGNWRCWMGNWWMLLWWFFYWGVIVNLWVRTSASMYPFYGIVHGVLSVIVYLAISRRTSIVGDVVLALLHPIFFLTFPLVVIYSRISRPRTFWAQRKFNNKRKS